MAEEISASLGELVDIALMANGAQEALADVVGDLGDTLDAMLIMLSQVHIKMGLIALLTPPEDFLSHLMPDDMDLGEYEALVNECTLGLGGLSELIQDVYQTGQRNGVPAAIGCLVEESALDQLDEYSENFAELATVLGKMVAELDPTGD